MKQGNEKRKRIIRSGRNPMAVITGASSGIGLELAKQFATHKFDLIVTGKSEAIYETRESLKNYGVEVQASRYDLASYEGVQKFYDAIKKSGRPVDCIAINAGVGVSGDFTRQTPLKDELDLINLNVVSVVHITKLIAADMVRRGKGRILFTSSIAALTPAPYLAVYAASKAFVLSFAEALRNELQDTGVTVTALMPGPTKTNFFRRAGMEGTRIGAQSKEDPALVAREGFEALMKGADHVVAGSASVKAQAALTKFMPESVKAQRHRQMAEPGSALANARKF